MFNRIIIYTNKIYTTNENIIDNNSDNATNKNLNDNNTDNVSNEKANENNTVNTPNGNVDDINTDNIQNPSENHENYLIKFKNNNKVLFNLFIIFSLIFLAGVGFLIYKLKNRKVVVKNVKMVNMEFMHQIGKN